MTPPLRSPAAQKKAVKASCLLALVVVSCAVWWLRPSPDALLAKAELALADREYEDVESLCRRVLARDPQSSAALMLAGEAATKLGRPDDAVQYFDRVPDDDRERAAWPSGIRRVINAPSADMLHEVSEDSPAPMDAEKI